MNSAVVTRGASFETLAGPRLSNRLKFQQDDDELSLLFDFLGPRRFKTMVELGVAAGRTSWILAGLLQPRGVIIGVDRFSANTGECRPVAVRTYAELARLGFAARLIHKRTDDAVADVAQALQGQPIEYLHIDAGHMYHDVMGDLALYGPLVATDGFIQFHDIVTRKRGCEVWRAWDEIKPQFERNHEFITGSRKDMGIGLVEVD